MALMEAQIEARMDARMEEAIRSVSSAPLYRSFSVRDSNASKEASMEAKKPQPQMVPFGGLQVIVPATDPTEADTKKSPSYHDAEIASSRTSRNDSPLGTPQRLSRRIAGDAASVSFTSPPSPLRGVGQCVLSSPQNSVRRGHDSNSNASDGLVDGPTLERTEKFKGSKDSVRLQRSDTIALQLIMSDRIAQGLSALPVNVARDLKMLNGGHDFEAGQGISSVVNHKVDPSLLFAMERTFLSSVNQAFYVMLLSSGFMMIDNKLVGSLYVYSWIGKVGFLLAIFYVVCAFFHHVARLRALEHGKPINPYGSLLITGLLMGISLGVVIAEFVSFFEYPVELRTKNVEIPNATS